MKLIVGLGNKGEKYKNNRHNVGFMFIDYLVEGRRSKVVSQTNQFTYNKYVNADICNFSFSIDQRLPTNDFILAKPQTYMNKSGETVRKLVNKYLATDNTSTPSISLRASSLSVNQQPTANNQSSITNNLIVVHDDLDIPFGKFRIVKGYGPKLHNGIESIQNHLHTMDFLRIRVGVDNRAPENRMPGIDYVLQDFTHEEMVQIPIIFDEIKERLRIEKIAVF